MEFETEEELKKHLYPALEIKVQDLKQKGINFISEDDLWKYLKEDKWKNSKDLNLSEMVNDILNFNRKWFIWQIIKQQLMKK